MTDFQLPDYIMHNCAIIPDPAAYVKEVGCASWLFLVGDEFAAMPGGISYAQVQAAVPHSARVISDPPRTLNLELARQQMAALDALPRPILVSCRSGPRASAAVYLYAALETGAQFADVMAEAERNQAPFLSSAEYKEWVRSSLEALRPARA